MVESSVKSLYEKNKFTKFNENFYHTLLRRCSLCFFWQRKIFIELYGLIFNLILAIKTPSARKVEGVLYLQKQFNSVLLRSSYGGQERQEAMVVKKKKQEERIVFLEGKDVNLRPLKKETDLPRCLKWMNDLETKQYLLVILPIEWSNEEKWFDRERGQSDIVLAIETKEGEYVGNIGLHKIDWIFRHGEIGIVIGEKSYREKGLGTQAVRLLVDYAFSQLNFHRVEYRAIADNERSVKTAQKVGFKMEGRRRETVYRNGKYKDDVILGLLKEEWEQMPAKHSHQDLPWSPGSCK